MGVVRRAQNSKKQVRMNQRTKLIRVNLGMKLIFLQVVRHTQTHLFHSVHSYGCDQAHLDF